VDTSAAYDAFLLGLPACLHPGCDNGSAFDADEMFLGDLAVTQPLGLKMTKVALKEDFGAEWGGAVKP
jgi:hypothetical protein